MTRANANALFQQLKTQPSFTKVIHIQAGDVEDKVLKAARLKIRSHLRAAFGAARSYFVDTEIRKSLFENRDSRFFNSANHIRSLDVRFLTQGSFAYGTLIRPAQPNDQEIDLDDGVYVPMPFLDGRPVLSSKGLFDIMQKALEPLVEQEGWTFKRKDTCIRIVLTGEGAHIDLPLFAVEEHSFRNLADVYEKRTGTTLRKTANLNDAFDTVAKSVRLQQDQILLADRNEDWRPSDPKAIHDWFIANVERFGKVLRRLCRYSKAWRDEVWAKSDLSSLALMAVCVETLGSLEKRPSEDRDDLLMLKVAEYLPYKIRHGGITWKEGERALDEGWSPELREEIVRQAEFLRDKIKAALFGTYNADVVVLRLREVFGSRIPNTPESVLIAAASQVAEVLDTKAAKVPMPRVGSSVSA